MYSNFTTEKVLRWCFLLEYCGPTIKYIKGTDNDVADASSRLFLIKYYVTEREIKRETLPEIYYVDRLYS